MTPPVALVVGATSGIGFAVAVRLFERGYRVYGAGRTAEVRVPVGVLPCPMDVRDMDCVEQGVRTILEREGRIDVLVGAAGRLLLGGVEETKALEEEQVWDVNYRGALRVVRAVLPSMRAARSGHIVQLCSLLTTMSMPFMSAYGAANTALRCASESLRHEVATLGIRVAVVIPSDRRTDLYANAAHAETRIAEYAESRAAIERAVALAREPAGPPEEVADVVERIVSMRRPSFIYRVGAMSRVVALLCALFPYRHNEWGMRRHMCLPRVRASLSFRCPPATTRRRPKAF